MLITDRSRLRGRPLEEVASSAVDGGANAVQLREKDLPAADVYDLALILRHVLRGRALVFVNGRLDVAQATGADGVHLPERGLPVRAARQVAGDACIVGRSVHSVEAAREAEEHGADYVLVGNVYATPSKPGAAAAGTGLVREVAEAVRVPVLAVGGITVDNVGDVIRAGADGVAVIGAILDADDTVESARALRRALDEAFEV
jgi:thiamine-phosphate pyrophosphorylase